MEELNVVQLTQRKESVHQSSDLSLLRPTNNDSETRPILDFYPQALVLRLRVLQIVCGISALVMGTVAFIEERRESNLGLGIPAGGATVIAAAASIHTWRERGRRRPSRSLSSWAAVFKSLGPIPLAILWIAACSFHLALLVQSVKTLFYAEIKGNRPISDLDDDLELELDSSDLSKPSPRDLTVLAVVQIALTLMTLACVATLARVEFKES